MNGFKKFFYGAGARKIILLSLFSLLLPLACRKNLGESGGVIRLSFEKYYEEGAYTRVAEHIPDTNDFILDIRSSSGKIIYSGTFGASPESIEVSPGSYTVKVVSEEFSKPAFSKPQFGDEQCIVVPKGAVINVGLVCRQLNSGVKLRISPEFLTYCPDGVLFLRSAEGKLMYGYSEKRIAYFNPGSVSLVLNRSGADETLFTRVLGAQEILTVGISVASGSGEETAGLSVSIDTSRFWINDEYVIGGDWQSGKGNASDNAMSVNQAKADIGAQDVWVKGYIVGGDLTSSAMSFEAPFSSATNIAIAARASVSDKNSCMSVSLPSGSIRDALNLPEHPELVGRQVCLKGDIVESYFGITGLKNISDYVLY